MQTRQLLAVMQQILLLASHCMFYLVEQEVHSRMLIGVRLCQMAGQWGMPWSPGLSLQSGVCSCRGSFGL